MALCVSAHAGCGSVGRAGPNVVGRTHRGHQIGCYSMSVGLLLCGHGRYADEPAAEVGVVLSRNSAVVGVARGRGLRVALVGFRRREPPILVPRLPRRKGHVLSGRDYQHGDWPDHHDGRIGDAGRRDWTRGAVAACRPSARGTPRARSADDGRRHECCRENVVLGGKRAYRVRGEVPTMPGLVLEEQYRSPVSTWCSTDRGLRPGQPHLPRHHRRRLRSAWVRGRSG